jgi:hypothetical protein
VKQDPAADELRVTLDLTLTEVEILHSAMAQTGNYDPARSPTYRALFTKLGDLLAQRRGT